MGGTFRQPVTRRSFIRRMAALSAAAWATPLLGRAGAEARAQTAGTAAFPAGTTLERTVVTAGEGPYFDLAYGPGWPIVVREDLTAAQSGRQDRRVDLASVMHYTDFQLVDAQSPARVEFLDSSADPPSPVPFGPAQRPQEFLVCHVVEALVRQTRAVRRSPVTGREVDCVVCTGDNIDNTQSNEMRWFLRLMDGGTFAPNSGAADVFEGVQSFDAPEYYQPRYYHPEPVDDPRAPDDYKSRYGYPDYPGLMQAAIAEIEAVGLPTPWFSAYGNHDFLVQGNMQRNPSFEEIATGPLKVLGPPPNQSPGGFVAGIEEQDPTVLSSISAAPARPVTPDDERHLMFPEEYIRGHLDSPAAPGPVGHGFTEDNLDPVHLYYTFDVAEHILGITLDTTAPALSEGTINQTQLEWLEQRLQEVHSRHIDADGNETTTGNDDRLVIIFSHHRPASMNPVPAVTTKAGQPERGFGGDDVIALLQRFPNVILWVNGHSHFNRIVAHPHQDDPTRGFWDLTTSAQIDPPQQARVLEVVDNRDGTLSIFTTVVDHAGPPQTEVGAYDLTGLAGIARELAYNDFQVNVAGSIGEPTDRNTELLLRAPFDLSPAAQPEPTQPPEEEPPAPSPSLPATGGGVGAAAIGAAVAGAVALRRRQPGGGETAAGD